MLTITFLSHLDHGLTADHLRFLLERYRDRDGFFLDTVELPEHLPSLDCGLFGPSMGDAPIADENVTMRARGSRQYASRIVNLPVRTTRLLTVIAGPHESSTCLLYTCFGGPAAPREPGDPSLPAEDREKSEAFWKEHALAADERTEPRAGTCIYCGADPVAHRPHATAVLNHALSVARSLATDPKPIPDARPE